MGHGDVVFLHVGEHGLHKGGLHSGSEAVLGEDVADCILVNARNRGHLFVVLNVRRDFLNQLEGIFRCEY